MKKMILILLVVSSFLAGAEIPVKIGNPVYKFISRMESKNIVKLNHASYPYSRNQIAKILDEVEDNRYQLSAAEINLLNEFLADYRIELNSSHHENLRINDDGFLAPLFSKNGTNRVAKNIFTRYDLCESAHLLTYEKDNFFIWGDAGFRVESQWKNSESRLLISDRYLLQGGLSKNLFFSTEFFRYSRTNNDNYTELTREEIGNWSMEQPEGNLSFDNVYSSLVYKKNNLSIGLYHQPLIWGRSYQNSLILSGYGAPFSYLGFDYNYKGIQFSFIHGSLLNDSTSVKTADFDVRNQEKYIVGHRIDFPLLQGKLRIGLSEMVIYGNRNIDPGYLLPVNFYWSIEHTLMDRDNSLMSLDFQTTLIPNFLFYGTFFLDELRFGELFNDWWANKHGIQLGARYSNELFSIPMDWSAEITVLRPWTYSHKFFINDYTNNGISLGFPYGGNSRYGEICNESWLNRRTKMTVKYTYLKHGYDTDSDVYGGDPTVSYEERNEKYDNSTKWLMGDIRVTDFVSFGLQYEVYNDAYISVKMDKYLSEPTDLYFNVGMNLDF